MVRKSVYKDLIPTFVVIGIIALLFGAIYILGGFHMEQFIMSATDATLLPIDKIVTYQGVQMPDTASVPTMNIDQNDPSTTSVDGKQGSAKSMFMFSYNKCDPACCDYSPYSCSGGCVCMTPDQINFVGTRGKNNKPNKCAPESNTI